MIYCFVSLEMTITRNRESQTLNKQRRLRVIAKVKNNNDDFSRGRN